MTQAYADGSLLDGLRERARRIRVLTVRMAHDARSPHVGSALSCVDLLASLFFYGLRVHPGLRNSDQDRFVLSKGHGCIAYYATLAERGYFSARLLATYAQNGSKLAEHPSPRGVPGIDVGTGSLGHGLAIASGAALARKLARRSGRQFVLVSDGECNEGSVWESAMFAAGRGLENLVVLVDYNNLQAMGRPDEITALAPLPEKWRSFRWGVREVDGHDVAQIVAALADIPFETARPSVIIAHTTKGKGISFMEDDLEWHYRPPSDTDLKRALLELGDF